MKEQTDSQMLAIPIRVGKTEIDLILVMREINFERLRRYDPATFEMNSIYKLFPGFTVKEISLAYATDAEIQKIMDDRKTGVGIGPTLKMLGRGIEYRPDLGDHDNGPYEVKPPGRG